MSIVTWFLLVQSVHAWETDQLSGRGAPLQDVSALVDAEMDRLLDVAVERTRRKVSCDAPDRRVERVAARSVARTTSRKRRVRGRGFTRGMGYGVFAAWLETADEIDRIAFPEREDVFGGIGFGRAPILATAGTCSTFCIAGVRMGADKPDHFLSLGHRYWRRAHDGPRPERGARWGTMTERTYFGWQTSSGFSRADLVANLAGQRFYETLFDPEVGVLARDDDGCVVRGRPFHWADHVDDRWDELLHPTTYRPGVVRWLDERLDADREAYCEGWDVWGPAVAEAVAAYLREEDGPEVVGKAKPREDVWDLARRCGGEDAP